MSYAALDANTQPWPALDEQLYVQQRLSSVEAAVALLPERCCEVFLLHRVERLSYSQIEARCGINQCRRKEHRTHVPDARSDHRTRGTFGAASHT